MHKNIILLFLLLGLIISIVFGMQKTSSFYAIQYNNNIDIYDLKTDKKIDKLENIHNLIGISNKTVFFTKKEKNKLAVYFKKINKQEKFLDNIYVFSRFNNDYSATSPDGQKFIFSHGFYNGVSLNCFVEKGSMVEGGEYQTIYHVYGFDWIDNNTCIGETQKDSVVGVLVKFNCYNYKNPQFLLDELPTTINRYPRVSPDKKKICYIKNTIRGNTFLAVNDINLKNEQIVWTSTNNTGCFNPTWISDNEIIFMNFINNGHYKVYKINLNKNKIKLVDLSGGNYVVNSNRLFYIEYDKGNNSKLISADFEGKNKKIHYVGSIWNYAISD